MKWVAASGLLNGAYSCATEALDYACDAAEECADVPVLAETLRELVASLARAQQDVHEAARDVAAAAAAAAAAAS